MRIAAVLGAALVLLAPSAGAQPAAGRLTIYAASSLTEVFPRIDGKPAYSFAGSNQLALQVRQGAPADVFASASPSYTQSLYRARLVEKPRTFGANALMLAVPRSNPAGLRSVYDLRRKDLKLVIGSAAVPIGSYTRQVLRKLGLTDVLSKVVSEEPDVKSIVGKLALGEADAGFVYRTDVRAAGGRLSDPDSSARAGRRSLRDCRAPLEPPQSGGTYLDPDADHHCAPPASAAPGRLHRQVNGGRWAFSGLLVLALCVALTFVLLPIVAIFWQVGLDGLEDGLRSDVARDAFRVTLKTNAISMLLILGIGTPAAYFLATRRFRGRALVITILELPLVLPPAVAGIGLLAAFGRLGLLGEQLDSLGITIGFTQAAVVFAITFVASPFYVRQAIVAFEAVDATMLDASRTLGAGPAKTFWRVALPLAGGGLVAGAAVALARGLGEFGATIMFAGSLQGVTQTVSLAIYQEFDVNLDTALAISAVLVVASGALLLAVKALPLWTGSRSTSRSLFARSAST